MINECAITDVVFEVHRSLKRGVLMLELGSIDDDEKYLQVCICFII